MWMSLTAPVLSLLPRRWRSSLASTRSMPWVPATIISGCLEAVCGLIGLVFWYSYSVRGWVQKSIDAQLNAHTGAAIPVGTEGFVGLLLIAANPFTWVIVAISVEGIVRACAALVSAEILGTFPLFIVDKIFALFMRTDNAARDSEDSSHAAHPSFFAALRQKYLIGRLPLVADELHYTGGASEQILEIRACRPKPEWDPPRVVRYSDVYFRLEKSAQTSGSRPFLYILRRLSAGVPGRAVLAYRPDPSPLVRN
jgi:hypothetical protein